MAHAAMLFGLGGLWQIGVPYYLAEGAVMVTGVYFYEVSLFFPFFWVTVTILRIYSSLLTYGNSDKYPSDGIPGNSTSGDIPTRFSTSWLFWERVYMFLDS